MNRTLLLAAAFAASLGLVAAGAHGQALGTAFTYQGELQQAGAPADGSFDFQFRLFDAPNGGAQIGPTVDGPGVQVRGGLFALPLDFGPAQFAGDAQWLQIAVRPSGSGPYTTLDPRTPITPTPYALGAAVALGDSVTGLSIVDGSVGSADIDAAQVQRRITGSCPAGQYIRLVNQDGSVTCGADAGGGVTSIATGAGLTGGPITASGTIAIANGGVGTAQINSAQVQRRITGVCPAGRYVRVVNEDGSVGCAEPTNAWQLNGNLAEFAPGAFLGFTDNAPLEFRTRNVRSLLLSPSANTLSGLPITATVIAGSYANEVPLDVRGATISGGGAVLGSNDPLPGAAPNVVSDHYGVVGGGVGNTAGNDNGSVADATLATVGGGFGNTASGQLSTVSGGQTNAAAGPFATIAGGANNQATGNASTVAGGLENLASDVLATIAGGERNTASGNSSTVSGGADNTASGDDSTVSGGAVNTASGARATVAGGSQNAASALGSAVAGGRANTASGAESSITGGADNTASGFASAVLAGTLNTASGELSTVSGGLLNCAGGSRSWAGGERAKVRPGTQSGPAGQGCAGVAVAGTLGDQGSFVWADTSAGDFVSTGTNQFLARSSGGFGFNTNSIPLVVDMALQARAGATNADLWLKPNTHNRGINLTMLPTTGAAEFRISQFDGTTFVNRLNIESDGDLVVTAQAFKPGGGSWANPSDARLKTDVSPLSGALERLLALRGVSYRYKPEDTPSELYLPGVQVGFLAQEVEAVFPDWVGETGSGYKTVGPRGFDALTVEALRELRAESATIDGAQGERLSALEAENLELRQRLERLEALLAAPR